MHGISSKILGDKTKDPEFLRTIPEWDILALSELHTDKPISIPGFCVKKQNIRPKHHRGPKIGGGLAVLIKHNMAGKFQLISNNNIDSIWIKTAETQEDKEPSICFYYCSPETCSATNIFEVVDREIELYNNKNNTFIFGDFNAGIKTEQETIIQDKFDDLFGIETEILMEPIPRNSEDMKIINNRGKEFLDICRINNLTVVNGRKVGDIFGKYTCHQRNGSSVVDYLISTHPSFKEITQFKVGDFSPTLSDHCPITAIIHYDLYHKDQQQTPTKMKQLENRYIWNTNNDQTFREVLSSSIFADKVKHLLHKQICPIQLAQEIRDLILEVADSCKIKKAKQNHQNNRNKPWFDKECQNIKCQIKRKGKLLNRNPKDNCTREEIYLLEKELGNLIKKNKYPSKKIHC